MTPKEKAEELIEKYKTKVSGHSAIKKCALIAVDEILEQCKDANFGGFSLYWTDVKQEIEKL